MTDIIPFEQSKIRKVWHNEQWYFSVIDIIAVLTDQPDHQIARKYWNKLAERLKKEGSQLVTKCHQLKMVAQDGKMRETDTANMETLLRLIQSVPSPKAEPLKLWLAKVGTERIVEIQDPVQGIDRARALWKKHGRSQKWIQQRMMGQETRNKLTDYWKQSGVKEGDEYAILTNIIHEEWRYKCQRSQSTQESRKDAQPEGSHERGRAHFDSAGRAFHETDCRDDQGRRICPKQSSGKERRTGCEERPEGVGVKDEKKCYHRRELLTKK